MSTCKTFIRTASDGRFDFMAISPENFSLWDMAHALSQICRFTGHCPGFYTVAHHSLLVARLVEPGLQLEALMHDAHEAYVGDMSTPLKEAIGEIAAAFGCTVNPYRWLEDQISTSLRSICGLPHVLSPAVKAADRLAYEIERDAFWKGDYSADLNAVQHMPAEDASREWFLATSDLLERKGVSL